MFYLVCITYPDLENEILICCATHITNAAQFHNVHIYIKDCFAVILSLHIQ